MAKKFIYRLIFLAITFLLISQQFVFAGWYAITNYNNYNPSEWAKEAVYHLEQYGLIQKEYIPYTDFDSMEGFRWNVRRDVVAYILVNLYEFKTHKELPVPENYPLNVWDYNGFETSVKKAYGIGLMKGKSDTDFGYTVLTRQEFATVLHRAAKIMGYSSDDINTEKLVVNDKSEISDWALQAVSYVYENGIMYGTSDELFTPNEFVTKEMMYTCIHRFALRNGIYDRLSEQEINSIEFTPQKPVVGDLEQLYSVINSDEKVVIQKALDLFPNAYETYVFIDGEIPPENVREFINFYPNKDGKEYARIISYSPKGDFVLHLNKKGIFATMKFSIEQYQEYEDLIFSTINLSPYKDIYLKKYDFVRQYAWNDEHKHHWEAEMCEDSNIIKEGTWASLSVEYDELYNGICIEFNDLYIG